MSLCKVSKFISTRLPLGAEVRVASVSLDDDPFAKRPLNSEGRIVPADSTGILGRIILGHLVEDLGVVLQGLKPMREVFRDVQHLPVLRGELNAEMLPKCRRGGAQVDDDIIDRSDRTTYQLHFRVRTNLKMHTAQTTLKPVKRNTALNHRRVQPVGLEFPPAEGTCKNPALVFVHLRFDHERAWQLSFRK